MLYNSYDITRIRAFWLRVVFYYSIITTSIHVGQIQIYKSCTEYMRGREMNRMHCL